MAGFLAALRRRLGPRGAEGDTEDVDWLIVGLGNPGKRYEGSRHNVGRDAVEALAARLDAPLSRVQHQARSATATLRGQRVVLAVPTTYMNHSGRAIGPLAKFYRIPPERVLVVYDEMDLPLGRLRLRAEGGAGGHNGMKSAISALGTQAFPRLRMGVGRPPEHWDASAHVLARFGAEERVEAEAMIKDALAVIEDLVELGVAEAMNRHNRRG